MTDKFTIEEITAFKHAAAAARERRFIELGQRGANADVKHPDRAEWERLRAVIANPPDDAA